MSEKGDRNAGGSGVMWAQDIPPFEPRAAMARRFLEYRVPVLIILLAVVHCLMAPASAFAQDSEASEKAAVGDSAAKSVVRVPIAELPVPVGEMRELILSAVARGDIEELRIALEWNELRPELGIARDKDAIEGLRLKSRDGKGLEILAILSELLSGAPARLPIGRDFENNHVFVWPYLAETDLGKLTPAQEIELYRLVPPEIAKKITETGKWTWYRLAIGADGTWHIFSKQQ